MQQGNKPPLDKVTIGFSFTTESLRFFPILLILRLALLLELWIERVSEVSFDMLLYVIKKIAHYLQLCIKNIKVLEM